MVPRLWVLVAALLPLSHGLLVPAAAWRHATQRRHAAPCMVQTGETFPAVEGVPSGQRAVLLVINGDESRAAEIDAIDQIEPELTAMNAVVVTLRNPVAWEAGADAGPCVSYVVDDAGVVVSRCDAPDNPTAHATGALRSVLGMPLSAPPQSPQPPPAADVPPPPSESPDQLSNLEAEIAKLSAAVGAEIAQLSSATQPPSEDDGVPPPPSDGLAQLSNLEAEIAKAEIAKLSALKPPAAGQPPAAAADAGVPPPPKDDAVPPPPPADDSVPPPPSDAPDQLSSLEARIAQLSAPQEGGVPPPPTKASPDTFVAGGAGDIFSQQDAPPASGSWSADEEVPESSEVRLDALTRRIEEQRAAAEKDGTAAAPTGRPPPPPPPFKIKRYTDAEADAMQARAAARDEAVARDTAVRVETAERLTQLEAMFAQLVSNGAAAADLAPIGDQIETLRQQLAPTAAEVAEAAPPPPPTRTLTEKEMDAKLDEELGRGSGGTPKGGMATPPAPPGGAAPGGMGYLRRNEKSSGNANSIGGAKNLEEWFQRAGSEMGPGEDTRGRDERLWGTKKDAGRSAADVQAGRSAMAEGVIAELESVLDKAAQQLGEDKQRTEAAASGAADPFSGWAGGRRRDDAVAAARRDAGFLRVAYSKGALVGVAPELLKEAEAMVGALEALAEKLEAPAAGAKGAEGGTPDDETPFDRFGKFLRGE